MCKQYRAPNWFYIHVQIHLFKYKINIYMYKVHNFNIKKKNTNVKGDIHLKSNDMNIPTHST